MDTGEWSYQRWVLPLRVAMQAAEDQVGKN